MATSNQFRDLTPRQTATRGGLSAGVFAIVAAASLLAGAGLGAVGYLVRPSAEPRPDISDAVTEATAPRSMPLGTAPDADVDDGTWTDADLRTCGEAARAAADVAAQRKLSAVSANRVGLGAPDPEMVRESAYLLCSATTKPRHLCQRYWNNALVEGVKKHARDFRSVVSSAYWSKVALADQARRDAKLRGTVMTVYEDLDQTTRDVARLHEEIGEALRGLVRDGIVSRDSFGTIFGFGIPTEIKNLLQDTRQERDACG
jgi:hypothetical protein